MTKEVLELCKKYNVRRFKNDDLEVEFFPAMPEPMNLDPVALSKVLADSMPPDSAMLFASTEDPTPEHKAPEAPLNPSEGNHDSMA